MFGRSLTEESPCCSECGGIDLVFVDDDFCHIMDATRGTLTCQDCGFEERATRYWRATYKTVRREPSERERKRQEDREAQVQTRMEENERWAKNNPAPEGWSYLFRLDPKPGDEFEVILDGAVVKATKRFGSVLEPSNRLYHDMRIDPAREYDGKMSADWELDERLCARRKESRDWNPEPESGEPTPSTLE